MSDPDHTKDCTSKLEKWLSGGDPNRKLLMVLLMMLEELRAIRKKL